ncbi:MAG: hypothetical protein RLZZ502_1316 [Pseudomonadota bacterium]
MPTIDQSLIIPFTQRQMFDLVNDVASYPSFLPWCGGVAVQHMEENKLKARVEIRFMGVESFFSTVNQNTPCERIDMQYEDGPFKAMHGVWQFLALGEEASKISFRLEYEFASKALAMVIGPVFHAITRRFVESFRLEAERRYA